MKPSATMFVTAALVLVLTAQAAEAKLPWGRDASRRAGQAEQLPRCNVLPPMEFVTGTLSRDSWNGWELDGVPMEPVKDCHVEVDGSPLPGSLDSGRRALVMGCRRQGVLVAYRVRILKPLYDGTAADVADLELRPSESDPTVGVIDGPK